jgi:high affinity Mn2+ porin
VTPRAPARRVSIPISRTSPRARGRLSRRLWCLVGALVSSLTLAPGLTFARSFAPWPPAFADGSWWALGGQFTGILQGHPGFSARYSNPELSFGPDASLGWTTSVTLGAAVRPWKGGALVVMPEYANGRGMPNASGVGGYPNGDIVRVPALGSSPYFARIFLRQEIWLGGDPKAEPADAEARLSPSGILAARGARRPWRLEFTFGKFAANDLFDVSDVAGDTRHGFLNWSIWEMGAWDYAADTRGYTWGFVVALEAPRFAVRAGVMLMPTRANGIDFDYNIRDSRSEVVEAEIRYSFGTQPGRAKALFYLNHAFMGNYGRSLQIARQSGDRPDITLTRQVGAVKVGAGVLFEQQLGSCLQAFLRASMNSGQTETFAFTEIDRSLAVGAVLSGSLWRRDRDALGVAVAVNGLSDAHASYLASGGVGFQVGDGALSYAPETILEAYYRLDLWRFVQLSFDVQGIFHPGYNSARGPAVVLGARLHAHL